ncbi:uncharacterized protein LOC116161727 [Photinus pyralis]|uniref:uncharacterized protein LOC116161727 n=1 Tax=Photinus pyralis TaxID=7054 RepID=UPI001266F008|nr:uncharacterized protein LOC116161727 [Photinus pyralis]
MNFNLISVVLLSFVLEVIATPKRLPCPTLKLRNGRVRYRQKNRFVKFTCNPGYIIAGERYSTCDNGQWDGLIPKCVRSSCTQVSPPANALIYPSHRGGVLNFFCKPGYVLRGENATYCDGLHWDNKLPSCIESNTVPKLQCDFETVDLCGWNHDLRHDFDWKRKNFRTPSGHLGTGPSYDHTKGANEAGYYMYIESSFRNINDTARLISPIYDRISDSDVCFEFYFHMYGSTTGQLRVYLKKESDNWKLEPAKAFFWKSGNHGEHWIRSRSFLGPIDEDFQIVIEGIRGESYYSDIAIDDVNIIPNCIMDDASTERDFEYTWEDDDTQSCANRCDTFNSSLPCDCDENCIDNNRCCLDYIATCVLGGTEEYSSMSVTTDATPTDESSTQSSTLETTEAPPTTRPTLQTTTTLRTTKLPTPMKRTPATTKRVTSTTTKRPTSTTTKTTTSTTTKRPTTTTTKTTTSTTTKRPTSTTTKKVTKKATSPTTKRTTKTPSTTKSTTTTQTIHHTTKIIAITLKAEATTSKPIQLPIDEIVTIPTSPDEEDVIDFTPFTSSFTSSVKKNLPDKGAKVPPVENRNIIIVAAVLTLTLLLAVLVTILIRRRRFVGCRDYKMKSSTSDSQSDVRFLTSDEILNFNLAYCDD